MSLLQCYKSIKESAPLTELPLNLCNVIYVPKEGRKKRHELRFSLPGGEALVLAVQSKEQAQRWLKVRSFTMSECLEDAGDSGRGGNTRVVYEREGFPFFRGSGGARGWQPMQQHWKTRLFHFTHYTEEAGAWQGLCVHLHFCLLFFSLCMCRKDLTIKWSHISWIFCLRAPCASWTCTVIYLPLHFSRHISLWIHILVFVFQHCWHHLYRPTYDTTVPLASSLRAANEVTLLRLLSWLLFKLFKQSFVTQPTSWMHGDMAVTPHVGGTTIN